ncbi:MAG TPA: hypothetical protein VN821_05990 [Candidatus Udaeobacter sp.]|nr:hypothetical protein [Candidatus Udaeobacter sp.]
MPILKYRANLAALPPPAIRLSAVRQWIGDAGLLAILVLLLCVSLPENSRARSEQYSQYVTEGGNGWASAWNRLEQGSMSGTIAFSALCVLGLLVLSTFGLWFMTWRSHVRQADTMKKLRRIATDAADASRHAAAAAQKSADALASAERAYLFIDEDVDLDLAGDASAPSGPSQSPGREPASPEKPNSVIKFTFVNRGRTPAILESIGMGVLPGLEPPARLDAAMLTLRATVPVGSVISANSRYERRLGCPFRLEQAARKQLEQRERRLYFLGRIVYKDVFGNSHETGFALEFEPNTQSFMRVLSDQLNYYT